MATLPLLESCRKARLKRPVELRCSVACTRDEDSLAAPGAGSSAPGSIGAVDSIAGYGMGSLCREGFAAAHTQARARTRCAVGSKSFARANTSTHDVTMRAALVFALCAVLPAVHGFDFDDEVVSDAPAGSSDFFAGADPSEGTGVPVMHAMGSAEPKLRNHLYMRASKSGAAGGRVTLRTSQAKLDSDAIDALKALAAAGGIYTISVPSVLSEPNSPPIYASASACALLASRFEEHLQLTMSSTKDRVLALSYALPVVPATCPTGSLPRLALDEVMFSTSATMHFPEAGPMPLGKIHDAAFLPPAAAQAAARAAAGQGGPGVDGTGEQQPQQQQSFLRKYWMYILPVVYAHAGLEGRTGTLRPPTLCASPSAPPRLASR